MSAYTALTSRFTKVSHLDQITAYLEWDDAVMLPPGSAEARAEQLAMLAALRQETIVAEETRDLIEEAKLQTALLGSFETSNLEAIERLYRHNAAVSPDLLQSFVRAVSRCDHKWREVKKESDFASLTPFLEEVISLVQQIATEKAEAFGCTPYEALLDYYDPGRTVEEIDGLFAELSRFFPPFIEEVIEHQEKQRQPLPLQGPFALPDQKKLARFVSTQIGLDFTRGRLDESAHPFCGGSPADVRITTRYDQQDFISSLMGVAHETGHALYEQGLPKKWIHQPVGQSLGMSYHESQSLLIEMQACRSPEFLRFIAPTIREIFRVQGSAYEADNLTRLVHRVQRSFIRVDADEVTYTGHILFRYELEKALLSGELSVKDLPSAWNEASKRYLGIKPENNAEGCMQDSHWMNGDIGYFPTYSLGAIMAAQLFSAATKSDPSIPSQLELGNFAPLVSWLHGRIHSHGSHFDGAKLIERATGAQLSTTPYFKHLKARYLGKS